MAGRYWARGGSGRLALVLLLAGGTAALLVLLSAPAASAPLGAAAPAADACAPRPSVSVAVVPSGASWLQVTVSAGTTASLPANSLQALRFGSATNALIDVPGGPTGATGSFTVPLPNGPQQTQFAVRQGVPGYTTVPLVVVDACGDWPTLVGGGPAAFLTATPTATASATSTRSPTATATRTPSASPTRTVSPSATPTATTTPDFTIRLDVVANGLAAPLYVTHAGDGSADLYVVEKAGVIRRRTGSPPALTTFLDIRSLVGSAGSEQGLLSVAFHPRYTTNGYLYVDYTDLNGNTVVARYAASADRTHADPATASIVLQIAQPAANHNGGLLLFGPDGYLYIGMGDGGGAGDQYHNGQNGQSLLGKLLRIDVDTASPYAIPPTNPFVGVTGMRAEIWALGLRNPWRYSFDRGTGDLYIADVGQDAYEEVDLQRAGSRGGQNYGWPIMEGFHCYPATATCSQAGLQLPIAEYPHSLGCSITGGYVYRGAAQPLLQGLYLFGDYCSGRVWTLRPLPGGAWERTERLDSSVTISSFGEDWAGEVYVTGLADGMLYHVVAVPR